MSKMGSKEESMAIYTRVHEVGLSDARYYLNTPRKGIQAAQIQQSVVKKSINTPVPHWGSDTDSSSDDDVAGKANPKIDSDSDDEDRSSQTSLVVERVPERHYKDLTPREVNQIQELHVFFVPPKVEYVQGRKAVHKAILFYGRNPGNENHHPGDGANGCLMMNLMMKK
jgi:hypothetical protein